jgi:hypothetical protein
MRGWHEYCFYNWVRCALGTILAGGDLLHKVRYDSCIWHGTCIHPDSYVRRAGGGSRPRGYMVGISAVCAVGTVLGWKDGNIPEKPGDYGGIGALLLTHTPLHRPYIV